MENKIALYYVHLSVYAHETAKDDFMKPVFSTLMAGIALITFGVLAFADQMGYLRKNFAAKLDVGIFPQSAHFSSLFIWRMAFAPGAGCFQL
jgi:hypothetical protein